nr:Gfo/Idh/MocA family oxidoreductase [Pirellulaceae bacterium]
MSETTKQVSSRREFLGNTGRIAAATAIAGLAIPRVHAAEDNTLQVALIGCGGRGTGAAVNALSVKQGPMKLVAAADVFENRVRSSVEQIKRQRADQVDVPPERQFVGFDGYQKAMDCLKPGDIAIFASPLAFRWVHFGYAIQKGLHVFMEKPVTSDGPTSRRMIKQAEEAKAKNLKVGVGLMSRHSRALEQLHQRIQDGEIGDIIAMRGYRMSGPLGSAFSDKWPGQPSELLWQIQRFHSF